MRTMVTTGAGEALHTFYAFHARRGEVVPGDYLSLLLPAFARLRAIGCPEGQESRRLFGLMTDAEIACAFHWLHCREECGSGWESSPWTRCSEAAKFPHRGPRWYELDKWYAYNEVVRRVLHARRVARLPWRSATPDAIREWVEETALLGEVVA